MSARLLCLLGALCVCGCQSTPPVRPSQMERSDFENAVTSGSDPFQVAELASTLSALSAGELDLAAQNLEGVQAAHPDNALVRGLDFELAYERHARHFFHSIDPEHDLLLRLSAALTSEWRHLDNGEVFSERLSAAIGGLGISLPYHWGWFDKTGDKPARTTDALGDLVLTLRHVPFASGASAWTGGLDFVIATGATRFDEGNRILRGFYRYGHILGDFALTAGLGLSLRALSYQDGLESIVLEPMVEGTWRAGAYIGFLAGYMGGFDLRDHFDAVESRFALGLHIFPSGYALRATEDAFFAWRHFSLGLVGHFSPVEHAKAAGLLELRYVY